MSELALRITDAEFVANTYIYGDNRSNVGGLHVINSFTGGSTVRSDNFTWNGPHATTATVAQYFEQHSYLFTKDELVAGAGISITPNDSDQTLTIAATGAPSPGGNDRRLFKAAMTDKTLAISSTALTYAEVMQLAAVQVNVGTFTLAQDTVNSLTRVVAPIEGVYLCKLHVALSGGTNRARAVARFVIGSGGIDTLEPSHGESYVRGQNPVTGGVIQDSFIALLAAGDTVGVQVAVQGSSNALTLEGSESDIELVRIS